jgi:para-aminobenzoate synthetase/4-amino-4-deoxychorismate lyase
MGIGSGVVWDSDPAAEYRECLLKARFLTEPHREFELIETMRWERACGCRLLPAHLQRLQNSAAYFDFKYDEAAVREALHESVRRQHWSAPALRVRLTLDRSGACTAQVAPLEENARETVVAGFARARTHSQDRFLFHKTTRREIYENELAQAQTRGWFDAIFLNERGEVTEGARSNVILKRGNEYFTPPLDCGVLPGVYRAHLLATQALPLREKIFLREEAEAAEEIWRCNAVRGMVRARLAQ